MATRQCTRCAADLPGSARFCVRCGEACEGDAFEGAQPPSGVLGRPVEVRLVHCPVCDGANAASRRYCGRCGAVLRDEPPDAAGGELAAPVMPTPGALPAAAPPAAASPAASAAAAPAAASGVPATLLVVTVLVGLAVLGVLFTILSARGIGLFAGPPAAATPGDPVAVEPAGVRASSEVPPAGEVTYGPANLLDGDETTAWKEGVAGDGEGEWVELTFDEPIAVARLLVWNGYQRPGRYAEHNRVASARIEVGGRPFTADLLDVEGPQAIDLPEPVLADRVRLVILGVHRGFRYEDTAISRLEVHVQGDDR